MPADYRCKNTFCVSGKYIYTIRKDETDAETFNYFDVFTKIGVLSSGFLAYYGKNWLIVRASTSSSAYFYFIKATPIDETLASQEDGFYDNPDNYTYEIIHTHKDTSLPSEYLLKHHANGYVSLRNFAPCFYFKALKEKIEDIADFDYNLSTKDLESTRGTFLSSDVFLAASFVEGTGTSATTRAFPSIFYKNTESVSPPYLRDKTFFSYPWHYFSELGYGYHHSGGSYYYYYMYDRRFASSSYTNYAGPWDAYMKNGMMAGSVNGNYLQLAYLLEDKKRIDIGTGMSSIVDEDFVGYLKNNYIIRIGDKFVLTYYSAQNMSFKKSSQIVMKYQGDIVILDFNDQAGDEIDGTLYTVSFDEENKKFNATFARKIKGSFSSNQTGLLKRVKQKNFFITKDKLYGLYSGHPDGILRFVQRDLPVELINKMNGATPLYTQTLYDGTVSFILSDGRTLIADLLFNEQTGSVFLRPWTGIHTLNPIAPDLGVRYQLLSPFKKYVYIFDPNKIMSKIEYFRKVLNPAEWNLIPQGQDNKPYNSSGDGLDYIPDSLVMRNQLGDEAYQGFLRENFKTFYQTYNHSVFMTGKKGLSPAGYILTEIEWRPWQN